MSAPVADPRQDDQPTEEQALLGALAVVLLANAEPRVAIAHALPLLATLGIAPAEGMAALALVLPHPLAQSPGAVQTGGQERPGPAQAWNAGTAITRRVEYIAAAAKRLKDPAHSTGRERAYLASHLRAQQERAAAAVRVDRAARVHGPTLGWYAVMDSRTTRDCRAANGAVFSAAKPPVIGYPGTLHGGTCRCWAGAPHKTTLTVDEAVAPILQNAVIPFPVDFSRKRRSVLSLAHPWK